MAVKNSFPKTQALNRDLTRMTTDLSVFLAFGAGLFSFISPCVLPLVPSYLSFITGVTYENLTSKEVGARLRGLVLLHSVMFILGFSAIFIMLGASASYLGKMMVQNQSWMNKVGGAIIIAFGLYIAGVFKFKFLAKDARIHFKSKPAGCLGSALVGFAFGTGWTPCIGPILGSILMLASTQKGVKSGVFLLSVYSLGLAIPFFLTALATDKFINYFNRIKRHMRIVTLSSGLLLIFMGLLIYINYLSLLSSYLIQALPFLVLN